MGHEGLRIVVTHLTRMRTGVCLAGLDGEHRHVRPVLSFGAIPATILQPSGPVALGALIDLGITVPKHTNPEVEDRVFSPEQAAAIIRLTPQRFTLRLERVAQCSLESIFGSAFRMLGPHSCGTEQGTGNASLGCLQPNICRNLAAFPGTASEPPKIRVQVSDGHFTCRPSVTDVRLYEKDLKTPRMPVVQRVAQRLLDEPHVLLSVGLSRKFMDKHWFQVNNIFFPNDPYWKFAGI